MTTTLTPTGAPLSVAWKEATAPMITAATTDAFEAIVLAVNEGKAGRIVRACMVCQPRLFREWLSASGAENVSHGYCPACFEKTYADIEARALRLSHRQLNVHRSSRRGPAAGATPADVTQGDDTGSPTQLGMSRVPGVTPIVRKVVLVGAVISFAVFFVVADLETVAMTLITGGVLGLLWIWKGGGW